MMSHPYDKWHEIQFPLTESIIRTWGGQVKGDKHDRFFDIERKGDAANTGTVSQSTAHSSRICVLGHKRNKTLQHLAGPLWAILTPPVLVKQQWDHRLTAETAVYAH